MRSEKTVGTSDKNGVLSPKDRRTTSSDVDRSPSPQRERDVPSPPNSPKASAGQAENYGLKLLEESLAGIGIAAVTITFLGLAPELAAIGFGLGLAGSIAGVGMGTAQLVNQALGGHAPTQKEKRGIETSLGLSSLGGIGGGFIGSSGILAPILGPNWQGQEGLEAGVKAGKGTEETLDVFLKAKEIFKRGRELPQLPQNKTEPDFQHSHKTLGIPQKKSNPSSPLGITPSADSK